MKAYKFYQAMERHPYLRPLMVNAPQELKPRHVHYIVSRKLCELPRETFSSIRQEEGSKPDEFWVECETWAVIFRIREDVEQLRGDPHRYCVVPLTKVNTFGQRQFEHSFVREEAKERGWTPEMSARDFIKHWEEFYRVVGVTPEFVAVVHIKRSWGIRYSTFSPARIVIYQ